MRALRLIPLPALLQDQTSYMTTIISPLLQTFGQLMLKDLPEAASVKAQEQCAQTLHFIMGAVTFAVIA